MIKGVGALVLLLGFLWLGNSQTTTSPMHNPQSPAHDKAKKTATKGTTKGTTISEANSPRDKSGTAQNIAFIKAKISTSRPEVTVDGGYGIFADLENVSDVPVTLFTQETVLVVQPEVTQTNACVYGITGFFPTEVHAPQENGKQQANVAHGDNPSLDQINDSASKKDSRGIPIRIQPSEHYTVFWDVNRSNTLDPGCRQPPTSWLDLVTFVPGEYMFTIDGKAYKSPEAGIETTYHTFTEKTPLRVSVPQIQVLLAAVFGAIIAYFVTALRPDQDLGKLKTMGPIKKASAAFVILRNIFSAALLGAAVTMVASRLADTQFPIKVSVNDVWGAMTIGFVSYFVGNKFIDKLTGTVPVKKPEPPQ